MKYFLMGMLTSFSLCMGDLIEVTSKTFNETIDHSSSVIVDVYADWCGPCKRLAPVMKELSDEYPQYTFIKIKAEEENFSLLNTLGVQALPTIIFYKNGKEIRRELGFKYKAEMSDIIKSVYN